MGKLKTTKEFVENFQAYQLEAQLQDICHRIMNLGFPVGEKQGQSIKTARVIAAKQLHDLGYSHRQIMSALGLKSPQSVTVYLKEQS